MRVVTDRSKIGMPEVGIGLIPDVGGTYILSRAPGLGLHAALSGAPFSGADAIALASPTTSCRTRSSDRSPPAVVGEDDVRPPSRRSRSSRRRVSFWPNNDWIDECYGAETSPGSSPRCGHEDADAHEAAD